MVNVRINLHALTIFAKILVRFLVNLVVWKPCAHPLHTDPFVNAPLDGLETHILSASHVS